MHEAIAQKKDLFQIYRILRAVSGEALYSNDQSTNLIKLIIYDAILAADASLINEILADAPSSYRRLVMSMRFHPEQPPDTVKQIVWTFPENANLGVSVDRGGWLNIATGGENNTLVAERFSAFRPGAYLLNQHIYGEDSVEHPVLVWEVSCQGRGDGAFFKDTISTLSGTREYTAKIIIPSECAIQHWTLSALGDSSIVPAYAKLKIVSFLPEEERAKTLLTDNVEK